MNWLPENIRQGETAPLTVESADDSADEAILIIKTSADAVTATLTKSASFTGTTTRTADLTLSAGDTEIPEGDYVYQVTVVYSDGVVEKYPEPRDCDDDEDCGLPTLTICESLDEGVSQIWPPFVSSAQPKQCV